MNHILIYLIMECIPGYLSRNGNNPQVVGFSAFKYSGHFK